MSNNQTKRCSKCGSLSYWSSYFGTYLCNTCEYQEDKIKTIKFTAIIKDGEYEIFHIEPKMFSDLVLSLQEQGYEILQLKDRSVVIVGILVIGKDVGDRIIVCGDYK